MPLHVVLEMLPCCTVLSLAFLHQGCLKSCDELDPWLDALPLLHMTTMCQRQLDVGHLCQQAKITCSGTPDESCLIQAYYASSIAGVRHFG